MKGMEIVTAQRINEEELEALNRAVAQREQRRQDEQRRRHERTLRRELAEAAKREQQRVTQRAFLRGMGAAACILGTVFCLTVSAWTAIFPAALALVLGGRAAR